MAARFPNRLSRVDLILGLHMAVPMVAMGSLDSPQGASFQAARPRAIQVILASSRTDGAMNSSTILRASPSGCCTGGDFMK
jgi:hypothetical protein